MSWRAACGEVTVVVFFRHSWKFDRLGAKGELWALGGGDGVEMR